MGRTIALVEDEAAIRENYADALRRQGYEISTYGNRRTAMQHFKSRLPELVLIDIGLGEEVEGGFDLCRELRGLSATLPIIFLTARDSDFDAISGLRLGADDYLTKDVSIPQILARVAALFRRLDALQQEYGRDQLHIVNNLAIDKNCMTVEWKGQRIDLTLTEFWIVHSLARIPGHV